MVEVFSEYFSTDQLNIFFKVGKGAKGLTNVVLCGKDMQIL